MYENTRTTASVRACSWANIKGFQMSRFTPTHSPGWNRSESAVMCRLYVTGADFATQTRSAMAKIANCTDSINFAPCCRTTLLIGLGQNGCCRWEIYRIFALTPHATGAGHRIKRTEIFHSIQSDNRGMVK